MFELNEAVRGRLIGPKSWDRIVIIFETSNGQPVQSMDCLCCVCWKLCINGALVCIVSLMAVKFGFTK